MVQIVWFKRDLRVVDHRPLVDASMAGPVLPLYVVEPDYWLQPDTSRRQWLAIRAALDELGQSLCQIGAPLISRIGRVSDVLDDIHRQHGINAIHTHEETGNDFTFERDKLVRAFCCDRAIALFEHRQFGVVRGLKNRNDWGRLHHRQMAATILSEPQALMTVTGVACEHLPTADALGLPPDGCDSPQPGTRAEALRLLESFFAGRGADYRKAMSSPLTGEHACSRLSVPLSTGAISIREVLRRCQQERQHMARFPLSGRPVPLTAIDSLAARLHWHCHFIQKLESEPALEWRSQHPLHQANRSETHADHPVLEAWAAGRTGFPFVDACMRSLIASGWLNFRMRAMVQAFASYHLALDWRASGLRLARLFTDYEPGIHWPQVQMQSGQTGINTPRIYNPVKQGLDQDPEGMFTRRWVPELARVPLAFLQEPWRMDEAMLSRAGLTLGSDYPMRIVDHEAAARDARARLTEIRRQPGYRNEARQVYDRHGSRKRTLANDNPAKRMAVRLGRAKTESKQLLLDF
jgi:deoxyribodipyrimidine photo-lyase